MGQPALTAGDQMTFCGLSVTPVPRMTHFRSLWAAGSRSCLGQSPGGSEQPPYIPGKEKAEASRADSEGVGENLHVRKTISVSHLPTLPWDLLDASWTLNSAAPGGGTSQLDSQALGQLWQGSPQHPSSAKELCHRCQPRAGPGTQTRVPIRATLVSTALTLESAPAKGSGASLRRNQIQAQPLIWQGAAEQPLRLVGQRQA